MQLPPSLVEHPLFVCSLALTVLILVGDLVAMGYWARAEARARGGSALATFAMFWTGIGLLYYVWVRYARQDWDPRTEPADRRERVATAYSLAVLLAFVVSAVVTPPEPVTQILALPPLFAAGFVASYLFVTRRSIRGTGNTVEQ